MQLDVKYVPLQCNGTDNKRYYQSTIIDEATRERFLYAYEECTSWTTVNFVSKAIEYFGYTPKIIQTNLEFMY